MVNGDRTCYNHSGRATSMIKHINCKLFFFLKINQQIEKKSTTNKVIQFYFTYTMYLQNSKG